MSPLEEGRSNGRLAGFLGDISCSLFVGKESKGNKKEKKGGKGASSYRAVLVHARRWSRADGLPRSSKARLLLFVPRGVQHRQPRYIERESPLDVPRGERGGRARVRRGRECVAVLVCAAVSDNERTASPVAKEIRRASGRHKVTHWTESSSRAAEGGRTRFYDLLADRAPCIRASGCLRCLLGFGSSGCCVVVAGRLAARENAGLRRKSKGWRFDVSEGG